jgi:S-adenosylmethionine-diacylglycerol 3-amino-3-carboxypropyl transferase
VLAVDTNPAQLACLALRTAAFQNLGHPEVLELLGWRPSQRRGQLFLRARCGLAPAYREFWEKNLSAIERGAVNIGRFEQYLRLFRRYVLPLIHGDQAIERLLMDRSPVERARFYREEWDTRIWRSLFKVFFSRMVMRRFGRDPSYFRYAEASLAARLLERIRHALVELPPSENPYLQWILLGEQATALPFALRRENFEAIRPNLHRLELRCSPVEDAVRQDGPFRRMNLSNVFEYMSAEGSSTLLKSIAEKSPPGARLAYWNMAVERRHPEWPGGRLRALTGLCEELFPQAKACFYRSLVIEEVL